MPITPCISSQSSAAFEEPCFIPPKAANHIKNAVLPVGKEYLPPRASVSAPSSPSSQPFVTPLVFIYEPLACPQPPRTSRDGPGDAARPAPPENSFGPATFWERMVATAGLLVNHGEYTRALGALWAHQIGSGMLVGSFMVLISGLGTTSPVDSVTTLTAVDLLSHIVPPIVGLHGAHLRDNADSITRIEKRTTPKDYAKGILWTGLGDIAVTAVMFGLAWGAAYHGLAGAPLLVPLAIVRTLQTCKSIYEFNLFNAFKARLPAPTVAVNQTNQNYTITSNGIRFVVLSMEATVSGAIFSIASASIVFAAKSLIPAHLFHPMALGAIVIGGLVACLPKLIFVPYLYEQTS